MLTDHTGATIAPRTVATVLGTVRLVEFGDPSGSPVLIVHGSPGGFDVAIAMGKFLARQGFRIIAPSRPGYPGTVLTEFNASTDDQAAMLGALLDELGITRAGVLAWSGGGPYAYRLAADRPDLVSALVVVAGLSRTYDWQVTWAERLLLRSRLGGLSVGLLGKYLPRRLITLTVAAEGDLTLTEARRRAAEIDADPPRRQFILDAAESALVSSARIDGVANDTYQFRTLGDLSLPEIDVPALIVWGDADTDVEPAESEYAAAHIPGAETLVIPGGTHMCLWVDPGFEEAQQQVVRFLAQADDRDGFTSVAEGARAHSG